MDELLEVVSEAVSAMVLYTVEADERNTRVVDIWSLFSYFPLPYPSKE